MDQTSASYIWFQKLMRFRKDNQIWRHKWVTSADGLDYYVAMRGESLLCFSWKGDPRRVTVTAEPFYETQVICNIFERSDCVRVEDGEVTVVMEGEVKIYEPSDDVRLESE